MFDSSMFYTVGIAGFGRALLGWIKESMKDKVIQPVEWMNLAQTLVIYSIVGISAGFGSEINASTMDVIAVGVGFGLDELLRPLTKKWLNTV